MNTILEGDALAVLQTLTSESVQCCVTSPPFYGLRDYGVEGQVGHEKAPGEYVTRLVAIFAEVRRVLREDGTCWVNMGDSYASEAGDGLKAKDLVGMPWTIAFALRDAGWWLRSDIIWHKPRVMPESVTDRPTKAHEYVFLMSKAAIYSYHADAIAEPAINAGRVVDYTGAQKANTTDNDLQRTHIRGRKVTVTDTRNARTVWSISPQSYPEAHFATFPEALAQRCILAGSRVGDVVLDPFAGSGTTCAVADAHQRRFIGIEINPEYAAMARRRVYRDGAPLFSGGTP
jgi:DNA modification methylase